MERNSKFGANLSPASRTLEIEVLVKHDLGFCLQIDVAQITTPDPRILIFVSAFVSIFCLDFLSRLESAFSRILETEVVLLTARSSHNLEKVPNKTTFNINSKIQATTMNNCQTALLLAIVFSMTSLMSVSVAAERRYGLAPMEEGHTLKREIFDRNPSPRSNLRTNDPLTTIQVVKKTSVDDSSDEDLPPLDGNFQPNLDTDIAASGQTTYESGTQEEDTTDVPINLLRGPQSSNIQVIKETPVQEDAESMPALDGNFQHNLDTDIAASSTVDITQRDAAIAKPSNDLQGYESYQKIDPAQSGGASYQIIDSTARCGDRCHHLRRRG